MRTLRAQRLGAEQESSGYAADNTGVDGFGGGSTSGAGGHGGGDCGDGHGDGGGHGGW